MEIFTKYGGMPFWTDFMDQFFARVTNHARLQQFFAEKDPSKVKEMQLQLLNLTVGGGKMSEDVIQQTHCNLGITKADFDSFLRIYEETLLNLGVDSEDRTYLTGLLAVFKSQVAQAGEEQ